MLTLCTKGQQPIRKYGDPRHPINKVQKREALNNICFLHQNEKFDTHNSLGLEKKRYPLN